MKKTVYALLSLLLLTTMAACSNATNAKDVIKKVDDGKDLSQKEYTVLMDYAEDYLNDFLKLIKSTDDAEKLMSEAENLDKKYPEAQDSFQILIAAEQTGKLEKENSEKFNKMMAKFEQLLMEATAKSGN
jgi:hypothetical protein